MGAASTPRMRSRRKPPPSFLPSLPLPMGSGAGSLRATALWAAALRLWEALASRNRLSRGGNCLGRHSTLLAFTLAFMFALPPHARRGRTLLHTRARCLSLPTWDFACRLCGGRPGGSPAIIVKPKHLLNCAPRRHIGVLAATCCARRAPSRGIQRLLRPPVAGISMACLKITRRGAPQNSDDDVGGEETTDFVQHWQYSSARNTTLPHLLSGRLPREALCSLARGALPGRPVLRRPRNAKGLLRRRLHANVARAPGRRNPQPANSADRVLAANSVTRRKRRGPLLALETPGLRALL